MGWALFPGADVWVAAEGAGRVLHARHRRSEARSCLFRRGAGRRSRPSPSRCPGKLTRPRFQKPKYVFTCHRPKKCFLSLWP